MFLEWVYPLHEVISALNVIKYITFRASLAGATSMVIAILFGPVVIRLLYGWKVGQPLRKEECPPLYALMGGVLILLSITLTTVLWADMTNAYIQIVLLVTLWLGLLGFWDDFAKIRNKRSMGLRPKIKLAGQVLLALIVWGFLMLNPLMKEHATLMAFPFFKDWVFDLGFWSVVFLILVLVGSSNAVNLTDGLDGLAIGCIIIAAMVMGAMSYAVGHSAFARYLQLVYIPGVGELTVFCAAIVGAGLGFLWFNGYPAQVFMGDTGSLSLGGALGMVAILIKKELILPFVGGIFVIEALSVMLQVMSFKLTGKRIFKCSPIHHHFEMGGWAEPKVTIRFWIVAAIFALFSMATLKLR
jgi:phospho-N-acetylmuramoyl-pentapeptide-transferase